MISEKISKNIVSNGDFLFLQLQQLTGVRLYENESVIIFDEVQLLPKARQAIKYLVADGRYKYIETGSLLSIKKNTKDILIPFAYKMQERLHGVVNVTDEALYLAEKTKE